MPKEQSLEEEARQKLYGLNSFVETELIHVNHDKRALEFYELIKKIFDEGYQCGLHQLTIGPEIKKQIQVRIDKYCRQIETSRENAILEYEGRT